MGSTRHKINIGLLFIVTLIISVVMPFLAFAETAPNSDVEKLRAKFDKIEAKLPVLRNLLSQCRDKGIPTDYETISYTIIKHFIQYGRDDINHGLISRARYVAEELKILYNEAIANLKAYLKGEKKPFEVPRYISGRPEIVGYSFIADTETKKVGGEIVRKRRPVFFMGHLYFTSRLGYEPILQFPGYGANIAAIEIGPFHVVFPPTPQDIEKGRNYSIKTELIEQRVIRVLEKAEENNIAVSLLLSPHYFPHFARQKWPEVNHPNIGWIQFSINAPKSREITETFLRTLIPMIKDYKSLHSLILSNESKYDTRMDPFAVDAWHKFLRDRYDGDINALNKAYGSAYASFEEVGMPTEEEPTPRFYDWVVFNSKYFAEWHEWKANIIHELAPDIPIHVKIFGVDLRRKVLYWGTNPEDFAQFSDIGGTNAVNWLGGGAAAFLRKTMLYDLLRSFRKMPVFNSEEHILPNRPGGYVPEQVPHIYTNLWQGAVHGRSASAMWVWERSYAPGCDLAGSVKHRPDVAKAVGRANLDLNRLAWEVTALQNAEAHVAILYSVPSFVYSPRYLSSIEVVYEFLNFSGQRAGFVSEREIQANQLPEYKLLIVPEVTHVEAATLKGIKDFVNNGGRVVIIGGNSLRWDEHNRELSIDDRQHILERSTMLPAPITRRALRERVSGILEELGLLRVMLIDTATGEPVRGVAWISTIYNDRLLVNICNYTDTAKNLLVKVDGKPVDGFKELISGKNIESAEILAETRNPLLLSIVR